MLSDTQSALPCLLVRAGDQLCALPLAHVEETMRPLPVRALPEMPAFVHGLATIRGGAVPVVHAASALAGDGAPEGRATRFVTIRTAGRLVALAVEEVVGVRRLAADRLSALPPLLAGANARVVSAMGSLDRDLLLVLEAGRLVPDAVWAHLDEART